ncbi:MAG: hypothetical protein U1E65_11510 [Myxococcota bacterium]
MVEAAFDRDLGYLDLFLKKLEAHAATLDAGRRAELGRLLGEERARWSQIRGILGGAAPVASNSAATTTAPAPSDPEDRPRPSFTVGSLIQR